ncbi:MAG TPA: PilZ domain-containing protein [Myxococcota bacterium]|nr:PilZ domain-containing protein [Myxococcota bacterium]
MTKQFSGEERRKHPRFAALSPALVVGEGGVTGHCLVEDLSAGGARISGCPDLLVGEVVRLLLQLPGRGPFSLAGRVVRRLQESAPGRGVAFGISFARVPVNAGGTVEGTVQALAESHNPDDTVVLVVDHSTHTCLNLVQDLGRVGRKAIAVTTPLDAIEWLLDGGSHIDTALVDIVMGQSDGCDLLSFLADEYPGVRRVVISDPMRAFQLERARQLTSPHAVLSKPWNVDQLAQIFGPQ